jgi:DNA-binding NarL/FixJ family response regulator
MKPTPIEVLFLSELPGEVAPQMASLRGRGMSVQVASHPDRALELLRRRPHLVVVDLIHGPALDPLVVEALNQEPRASRVVALHEGSIEAYIDQVEDLTVDGFCRIASLAGVPSAGM